MRPGWTRSQKSTCFVSIPRGGQLYGTSFFRDKYLSKLPFQTFILGDSTASTRNPVLCIITLRFCLPYCSSVTCVIFVLPCFILKDHCQCVPSGFSQLRKPHCFKPFAVIQLLLTGVDWCQYFYINVRLL